MPQVEEKKVKFDTTSGSRAKTRHGGLAPSPMRRHQLLDFERHDFLRGQQTYCNFTLKS